MNRKKLLLLCLTVLLVVLAMTMLACESEAAPAGIANTDADYTASGYTDIDSGEGYVQIGAQTQSEATVTDSFTPELYYLRGANVYYNSQQKKLVIVSAASTGIIGASREADVSETKNSDTVGATWYLTYWATKNSANIKEVEIRYGAGIKLRWIGFFISSLDGAVSMKIDSRVCLLEGTNGSASGVLCGMSALKTAGHGSFDKDGKFTPKTYAENVVDVTGFKGVSEELLGYCCYLSTSITEVKTHTLSGGNAFIGCSALTTVTVENTEPLTSIGANTFKGCSALKTVTITGAIAEGFTIGNDAFAGVSGLKINVSTPADAARLRAALPSGASVTVVTDSPIKNELTFEGYQVRVSSYNGLRTLFRYDESVKAENENNGFTFEEYGVVALSAAKFASICSSSVETVLSKAGTNGIVAKVIESADGTGERKFVDKENKVFCLALVNMAEANYMEDTVVFAYSKWSVGDEVYYNFTWCDSTAGEMSLYDATLTLFKRGLINSDMTKDSDTYCEEAYLWDVLAAGAYKLPESEETLPSATISGSRVSAVAGYNFTDGYFTYLNLPYHAYTPAQNAKYGYSYASDGLEKESTTGISWSLLRDGDSYVVAFRDSNGGGKSVFPAISLGSSKLYMPYDMTYGTPNSTLKDYTIYSPTLPKTVAKAIKTMVIDYGIEGATGCYTLASSSVDNASIETLVYPESFKTVDASATFQHQKKLKNVIYAARDKDALEVVSFEGQGLWDLRGLTSLNLRTAFYNCAAIDNLLLPKSADCRVDMYLEYLFSGCSSLVRAWFDGSDVPDEGTVDLSPLSSATFGKEMFNFTSDKVTDLYLGTSIKLTSYESMTSSSANAKSYSTMFGDSLSYTLHTDRTMLALLTSYYEFLHKTDSTHVTSKNYQDNVDKIKVEIDQTALTIKEWKDLLVLNNDFELNVMTSRTVAMEGVSGISGTVATAKIYDQATGKSAGAFAKGDLGYFSVDLKSADVFGVVNVAICNASGKTLTSMDFKITSQETNTCLRFTATGEEAYVKISLKGGSSSKIIFANPEFYHSSATGFTFVRSGYFMKEDGSWTKTQYKFTDYYTTTALTNQIERCNDVLVNGNYLFAISSALSRFYSFDISDPENPVYLDCIENLGDLRQMEFTSDKKGIVVAARTSQTYIFDVSDPKDLKIANRIDNLELSTGLDVSGNYCAIADRTHGVTIFDISDIYNPVGISNAPTGETQDVDIYGNFIYCGIWGDRCIRVIDISDIDNPVVRTDLQRSLSGRGDGLTIRDGYLYAATGQHDGAATSAGGYIGSGFEIWDIRDPENPVHVSTARMDGSWAGQPDIWKIEISGDIAYVCGSYNGVYIYDISNKKNPVRLEHIQIVAKTTDDRYSPVANTSTYPYPFDVTVESHCPVYNIACVEGYMYMAGSSGGIFIHKTENAHVLDGKDCAPVADVADGTYYDVDFREFGWSDVVTFDTEGSQAWAVATNGKYIYVASGTKGIRVLDKNMKQIFSYPTLALTMDVKIAGDVLVTAECDGGIAVYTINSDGSLKLNSSTQANKGKFWYTDGTRQLEITPNGKYVLAYCNAYMTLFNISDRNNIVNEYYNNRAMIYQRFIGFGSSTVEHADGTHTDYIVAYMGNNGKGAIFEFDREAGTYRRYDWKLGLSNNRGLCAYGDKMFASIDKDTVAMFSPAEIVAKYGVENGTIEIALADMPEATKFTLKGEAGAIGPISIANGYLYIQGGQVSNMRVVDISDLTGSTLPVVEAMDTRAMAGHAIEFNGKTVMAMGYAGVVSFTIE